MSADLVRLQADAEAASAATDQAQRAHTARLDERDGWLRDRLSDARALLMVEASTLFDAGLAETEQALRAARSVAATAVLALGQAKLAALAEQGTLERVEWAMVADRWNPTAPLKLTGARGVVQVFSNGDPLAENVGNYRRPLHGKLVLRLLKKDGSPGLIVRAWPADSYSRKWLPPGVAPEGAAS